MKLPKKDDYLTIKLETPLKFYTLRNRDGQFFRAKGYGGAGNSWVADITKAKFYGRPGPAKAQITFWAKNYPSFGTPVLIELVAGSYKEIPQEERVVESVKQKKVAANKKELKRLTRERDEAQAKLERLASQGKA
jgi:hypothetical protein